jgi:hypothetical protein
MIIRVEIRLAFKAPLSFFFFSKFLFVSLNLNFFTALLVQRTEEIAHGAQIKVIQTLEEVVPFVMKRHA